MAHCPCVILFGHHFLPVLRTFLTYLDFSKICVRNDDIGTLYFKNELVASKFAIFKIKDERLVPHWVQVPFARLSSLLFYYLIVAEEFNQHIRILKDIKGKRSVYKLRDFFDNIQLHFFDNISLSDFF